MIKWIVAFFFFSISVFAAEGAHHADEGIPYKLIITQSVNFLVFVGIMVFLLRKELAKHFAQRKSAYLELVQRAEVARSEAEATRREVAEKLQKMEATAEASMKQAEVEAEEMHKKMMIEAAALSERMKSEAKKTAEMEIERARVELREEILRLASDQAEKSLREKIGETEKKRLQNEFADKIQVVR